MRSSQGAPHKHHISQKSHPHQPGAGRLPLAKSIEPEWSWISARDARLEAAERIIHNHEEPGDGNGPENIGRFFDFFSDLHKLLQVFCNICICCTCCNFLLQLLSRRRRKLLFTMVFTPVFTFAAAAAAEQQQQ